MALPLPARRVQICVEYDNGAKVIEWVYEDQLAAVEKRPGFRKWSRVNTSN